MQKKLIISDREAPLLDETVYGKYKVSIYGFTQEEYKTLRQFIPEERVVVEAKGIIHYNYKESVAFFITAIPILKEMGYEIIDNRRQETE